MEKILCELFHDLKNKHCEPQGEEYQDAQKPSGMSIAALIVSVVAVLISTARLLLR